MAGSSVRHMNFFDLPSTTLQKIEQTLVVSDPTTDHGKYPQQEQSKIYWLPFGVKKSLFQIQKSQCIGEH